MEKGEEGGGEEKDIKIIKVTKDIMDIYVIYSVSIK